MKFILVTTDLDVRDADVRNVSIAKISLETYIPVYKKVVPFVHDVVLFLF